MDSMEAFARGEEARRTTEPGGAKVFDWDKAARILVEQKADYAEAGLESDWEWTGGVILRNGAIVEDDYTYLSSIWATPMLLVGGNEIPCFVLARDTKWRYDTKWPASAVKIFREGRLNHGR